MPTGVSGSAPLQPTSGAGAAKVVEALKGADFQAKVLNSPIPVAVEFMNYACGDCRKAAPMVEAIAATLVGKVKVYTVNVPVEKALADQFGIYSTPTFIVFSGGKEISRDMPDINASEVRKAMLAKSGIT